MRFYICAHLLFIEHGCYATISIQYKGNWQLFLFARLSVRVFSYIHSKNNLCSNQNWLHNASVTVRLFSSSKGSKCSSCNMLLSPPPSPFIVWTAYELKAG